MEVASEPQIEFNRPAADYVGWLEGIGPGCDFIVEKLRQGDLLAFGDVIQQFLFDHPILGENLHDEVEEGIWDGSLVEECELPEDVQKEAEAFFDEPSIEIQFMDTEWSHGTALRARDLADYSQEIEEIAMSLKTLETNMTTLLQEMAVVKTKVETIEKHMATKDWLNLRLGGLLLLTFLAGLGVLKWETLARLFGH